MFAREEWVPAAGFIDGGHYTPTTLLCDSCGERRWPTDEDRHADPDRWVYYAWWSTALTPCDGCDGEVDAPALTLLPNVC